MPRLNKKLTPEEKEDQDVYNTMIKRGLQSGADLAKEFNIDFNDSQIIKKYGPLFKKLLDDKKINKTDYNVFGNLILEDNIDEKAVEKLYQKYSSKKSDVIKIKKSELKKLIKKGFEDELFKEKKRDSLMKLYEEKEYDDIITFLTKKGLINGEGFTKGSPEAKAHAEKMRKAKVSKRERSPSPEPKKESKEKIEVVKGIATATKKGKAYNIKAKSGINKDLPQEVINEGSKLLRDSIDDHIKIKYFHPDYKNDKKKYRWI